MRDWSLSPRDPLCLSLAADFRLCEPDYLDDHIWELEIGGGEPCCLALRTTYGLRARSMRIFPRFSLGAQVVTDPGAFHQPVRLKRFYPSYMRVEFSPFAWIDATAEYWIPDSHSCCGRLTLKNSGEVVLSPLLELCGQLVPLEEGKPLAPLPKQLANVLTGRTSDLAPVLFMTGGPQVGPGPLPSLGLSLSLKPGESRTLTWCEAAEKDESGSLERARLLAARPWEAELARLEMVNARGVVEIHTGEPDWDAALAFSQKTALGLFFRETEKLPHPSYVESRGPDNGYSRSGDASEYGAGWSGQTPLESLYLASLLPGSPELSAGLLRNFLSRQEAGGEIKWKAGLLGQSGRWLAPPLLASLAWETYLRSRDRRFLTEVMPGLEKFIHRWLSPDHDRDGDGFPEWDHPLQTGWEDNPTFTVWQPDAQGLEIQLVECPALAAMLCRELEVMALAAGALGEAKARRQMEAEAARLRELVESCRDEKMGLYRNRDRDSHLSPVGRALGTWRGAGTLLLNQTFKQPLRLLVRLVLKEATTLRPEITLNGHNGEVAVQEKLTRLDFKWGGGVAVATSTRLYTGLDSIEIAGLEKRDKVLICVADLSAQDITLLLPLWAHIPAEEAAEGLAEKVLHEPEYFGREYGLPACMEAGSLPGLKPSPAALAEMRRVRQAVHMPWNALFGLGLVRYGLRGQAAELCTRLMSAVTGTLKQQHAFYSSYEAETGAGMGERNALPGLAPVGLFLETLGVRIESTTRVALSGKNPFPWSVTVKYRGMSVTRRSDETVVVFPDGRTTTLQDPTEAVVSID